MLQTLEVSEATLARWRKQYGGMKCEEAKRLRQLEDENDRLKRLVADLSLGQLDAQATRRGKLVSPSRKQAAVVVLRRECGSGKGSKCL